ncbi:MAG: MFS transporter [Bryobacteraceae bacterium]|nr:MFS transporter [Solibacteraceae bacterium]MCO5350378.1 MFS transporter [Bryobacteraceae bacterium]
MQRLTGTQWLICIIAAIGFAFDIYELLMLPLIVRPALMDLGGIQPGTPAFNYWVGLLFWVPAIAGGLFGLYGGYLTDRFGRRRVLVWSILLYAFSACAAGFSTSLPMLLFLRTTTFIGVCVEFVAAVAWLAELFPDPKRREAVLGYTQAFSSLGGLMVTGAYFLSVQFANSLPAIYGDHTAWRYTLISGVIPALPLIIIRPFLPESPIWAEKKKSGTLKRASIAALFSPQYRQVTIVTTILFACGYGAAFGAIQSVPRIVPGLPEVAGLARPLQETVVSAVQFFQEMGGLAGRFLLAFLAIRIVGRRFLLRIFQIPGLIVFPFVFFYAAGHSVDMLKWGIAIAGALTIAQFSFWGNYLPRVYPTHLRGTGESFAANIGGRMIGTSAAFITAQLSNYAPGATPAAQLAWASGVVAVSVYVIGVIASFWLKEPEAELPD